MSNLEQHCPAFPTFDGDTYDGMQLLDYFACKAMVVVTEQVIAKSVITQEYNYIAKVSYEMANAMMEERKNHVK